MEGAGRKEPTQVYVPEDPKEYADSANYYATQDFVKRQKIVLRVQVEVIEYRAKVFRHRLTGSRVHGPFPPGYDTDVNEATVNGLCKEFSSKTEQKKKELGNALMTSAVLNTDFTTANVDGASRQAAG